MSPDLYSWFDANTSSTNIPLTNWTTNAWNVKYVLTDSTSAPVQPYKTMPPPPPAKPKPESALAWLDRRVDEICAASGLREAA